MDSGVVVIVANLNQHHRAALLALGKLSAGQETFLNVLDADALVALGLADIFGKGQYILTPSGEEMVAQMQKGQKDQ